MVVWEFEEKLGSCLASVPMGRATNWRPYSIPRSATNCSMRSALPLAFYGAKLLNLFQSGVYFPEKNAAALRGAQRLRCVESMGTGCLM